MIKKLLARLKYQAIAVRDFERAFVFNIGLPKTATTSLHVALQGLGYNAINYPPIADVGDGTCRVTWPWWMDLYDAGGDIPVTATYRDLYAMFPNATFLMTVRDRAAWLESCRKHFTVERAEASRTNPRHRQNYELNRYFFGTAVYDRAAFGAAYDRHMDETADFFANRGTLTAMDVAGGDGWDTLCPALGVERPDRPFPVRNTRAVVGGEKVDVV